MRIIVDNQIIIKDATSNIRAWCHTNLVLKNPDFYKKQKMGKWTGNTPQHIFLYEQVGNDLWLPFGCLQDVWRFHPKKEDYDIQIHERISRSYQSNINLYDYQKIAVQKALEKKNGVIVMPTGGGKTQCGLEIVSRLGCRALWLTHTQDLLNQSKARAQSVLDIDGSYGTITAGKVNIGTHITFATVQTMAKLDLQKYKDCWDVIIVDEVHHAAGSPTKVTQFYKVLSALSARYKIGLTATPKRADGLEQSMFALLGGIICEIDRSAVVDTTCPVKVIANETGYYPDCDIVLMGDGTINYAKLVDNMIEDGWRYLKIFEVLKDIKPPILILANRVKYIEKMNNDYNQYIGKSVCISTLGQSKFAKEQRKKVLRQLNDGEIDAVFGTYQIAKEGLDVPKLRYVVFATPEKDETTITQAVGRVARKADGKEYGTVIDFVDDFGMYRGWAKKRKGYYKKIGAEI